MSSATLKPHPPNQIILHIQYSLPIPLIFRHNLPILLHLLSPTHPSCIVIFYIYLLPTQLFLTMSHIATSNIQTTSTPNHPNSLNSYVRIDPCDYKLLTKPRLNLHRLSLTSLMFEYRAPYTFSSHPISDTKLCIKRSSLLPPLSSARHRTYTLTKKSFPKRVRGLAWRLTFSLCHPYPRQLDKRQDGEYYEEGEEDTKVLPPSTP